MEVRHESERSFRFTFCDINTKVFGTNMRWGFQIEFVDDKIVITNGEKTYRSHELADNAVNEILLNHFDVDSQITLVHEGV